MNGRADGPLIAQLCADMPTNGAHRVIEQQAVLRAGQVAVAGPDRCLTYKELNQRANFAARHLIACGLHRGSRVIVNEPRSVQTAVVLLGILKAGAAYTWLDDDDFTWGRGAFILKGTADSPSVETVVAIRSEALVGDGGPRPSPNLPIVTRASDIACVLPLNRGFSGTLVPHATITALQECPVADQVEWCDDFAAFDLWLALMRGSTVVVAERTTAVAA